MMKIRTIAKHTTSAIVGGTAAHFASKNMLDNSKIVDVDIENRKVQVQHNDDIVIIVGATASVATGIVFDYAVDSAITIKKKIQTRNVI